jgi:aminoglycoside phosphotransferase family enzyme/predicted kinase
MGIVKARSRSSARKRLPASLLDPSCYPHPVRRIRLLETHLSWVFLTGDYAYKVKKPVDLGFVNFRTLARRRHACAEEVRLNRRLAPRLYLDVVAVRGTPRSPRIGGGGSVLDYAVRMRQFPQEALASRALAAGRFGARETDALADLIVGFHAGAPAAAPAERYGSPRSVLAYARQNFRQMLALANTPSDLETLRALRDWTEREHARRREVFAARKAAGFVRECHGDLHLGNVVLLDGRPVPFDCIEFSDELRFSDVMSEVAFLAMDLADRGRDDLAWRFVNRYLEATGDYPGIAVLRYYLVYRALVRAKVHLMRSMQAGLARRERVRLALAFRGYLRLAWRFAAPHRVPLVIAHGLSGSGKTTATQPLIEALGAIRVRSDIERKRMHGLPPLATSASEMGRGIYTRTANAATYRQLAGLARDIVRSGFPVVVDAAFLKRSEREALRAVAEELDVRYLILDLRAPLAVLRARVAARNARGDDASEADPAVLERQIETREPLTPAEMAASIAIDGRRRFSPVFWRRLLGPRRPGCRLATGSSRQPIGVSASAPAAHPRRQAARYGP